MRTLFSTREGGLFIALMLTGLAGGSVSARNVEAEKLLSQVEQHYFIENKGQWPSEVLYLSRLGGMEVWITKWGVSYDFYRVEGELKGPERWRERREPERRRIGHVVHLRYLGANPHPVPEGRQKLSGYHNYLIGNDPSRHARGVGLYREVWVKGLYPGIDVRYYFDGGWVRYDYVVEAGVDVGQIGFEVEGVEGVGVDGGDDLVLRTVVGEVRIGEMRAFQGGREVLSCFERRGRVWGVKVVGHDESQPLVIDPLVYSTYLGGSEEDWGWGIAVDGSGHAYVTGGTLSTDFDITPGAYQTTIRVGRDGRDVFVMKLSVDGRSLVYSTYLGGSSWDEGHGIAVDGSGHAYVTGFTWSTNFDITAGAYQTTVGGGSRDVFVTKLSVDGRSLEYSTYLGGSRKDEGLGIAVDGSGHAYVTGFTGSSDFDITPGAYQTTLEGGRDGRDVFVTKLSVDGRTLVYSTYLGGSGDDEGAGIAVDRLGQAYVTGATRSSDFDITPGAYQTTLGGYRDVFVTKLSVDGRSLVYSTYLGGSAGEVGLGIAVDGLGHAYVTGRTESTDFDITPGAYQTTHRGNLDVFVTKLSVDGRSLVYSTYLGGSGNDEGYGIAVDGSGHAYVTGFTWSTDFDITSGAHQTTNRGNGDVFVTKLSVDGGKLMYSTYLGGSGNDGGSGIAVDGSGHACVTGFTGSSNFDITPGAYQTTLEGFSDAFVTKLRLPSSPATLGPRDR